MSVQILFVVQTPCKSKEECTKIMREAYNAVVNNDIFAKWIKEDETDITMIDTAKTDFVIFERFEGNLYKKVLHSKSVRILAPLCLLQCIKQGKPIPNSETPLVSLAMENCLVVCSCLPKESKRDFKFKVQAMAGLFSHQFLSNTTHLVTNGVKSEKYNVAVDKGIEIMSVEFINSLWEASKTRITHASDEEHKKFKCPVFLNLNISITGFAKNDTQVQTLIEQNGGKFTSTMTVQTIDILICKSSKSTSSEKYKTAMKNNIECMTADWIIDSVAKGYALPNVADYAVKAATSTPTKRDAFIDPNFSMMSMIVKPGSNQHAESAMQSVVEQTVDESYLLGACAPATERKKTPFDGQDIDSIDIKKVKASGPFLDGCVIFVAGFPPERREKLNKILNFSGAMSCLTLNERITHAIIGNPKCLELKQIASKHLPCAVVSVAWLLDSMHQQMPADVDKYLLHCDSSSEQNSLEGGTSSPLSKKGLTFLRADVTIPDVEPEKSSVTLKPQQDTEDCVLKHYLNSMQGHNSVDDALAAFTLNPAPSEKNASANPAEATSPSISITIDESIVPAFADVTFVVLNYPQVQEDIIIEQIRGMQGTIVGADYQGVIDYAIVPIDNRSVDISVCNVVTYLWVAECVEKKRLITECEYHHLPFAKTLNVLHGLCISISGVDTREKEFLSNVITQLGGIEQDCMARRGNPEKNTLATTHLICNEPSGKKYQGALKWGLPVLHRAWLFKCAEEERRVDEGDFLLGSSKVKVNASSSKECQQPATFTTPIRKRMIDEVDVKVNASSSKECHQSAAFTTPIRKRMIAEVDVCKTPNNMALPSCSQITPVNEIMARVRQMCGGFECQSSPRTPVDTKLDDTMETPDTPYGRVFQDPPPPELRKKWKRWLDSIPTPKKDPSTPLSEIRRQLWAKVNEGLRESPLPNRALHREFIQSELKKMFSQRELDKEDEPMDESTPADDTENAMNDLVIAQFNELESHMMSSGGSARRQSIRKMEREGGVIPERESQPMSVGWDDNMVLPTTIQAKPKNFMLSCVDSLQRESLVEKLGKLGATVSALSNFDPSSTHLLCERFGRSEKLLASLASGLWILHISYASDSAAAGKFLNEEDYEFGNSKAMNKYKLDSDSLQKAAAAKYWREEIGRRGYPAFHDVRAIVHANKKEPMVRVLIAGGAVIVEASAPFEENISATHCFLEVKSDDLKPYIPLAQQGILCVNTFYVNDFLQKTAQNINDYIIPGFRNYY